MADISESYWFDIAAAAADPLEVLPPPGIIVSPGNFVLEDEQ